MGGPEDRRGQEGLNRGCINCLQTESKANLDGWGMGLQLAAEDPEAWGH